ncbi:MAG: GNAT family N-acetyltransferase [Eubacteriales bacterium]
MIIKVTNKGEDLYKKNEFWGVYDDDGETLMAGGGVNTLQSRYCGNFISTLAIGGLGTGPEYRRRGCIRRIMEDAFALAPERGWVVSMLHPFSYSYYRMFGYEKISDHKILEFPMSALDCFERCADLKRMNSEELIKDAITIYDKFSENINIMFRRYDSRHYKLNEKSDEPTTFIWYDKQCNPASYITLSVEKYYSVNRMVSINLNVYEMAFTSPESLSALFGFMRMYEGELETIKIHDCAMSPEIDLVLRHYMQTKYTIIPDIMGRILNVEEFLKANTYPEEHGHFVVKVEDTLDFTRGVYEVEYENSEAEIKKIADTGNFDICVPMPAFTQMLYGYESFNVERAKYLQGVELKTDAKAFFKAFPKRDNGLFEHF